MRAEIGLPATTSQIGGAEARLGIRLPEPVRYFYHHYNGLSVSDPALTVFPLNELAFLTPRYLRFATVDHRHRLCFDVSHVNQAQQWDICSFPDGYVVTLTMASFWGNKLWHWLDHRHPIWESWSRDRWQ
jgi:cell wall assembly regulator SMI1